MSASALMPSFAGDSFCADQVRALHRMQRREQVAVSRPGPPVELPGLDHAGRELDRRGAFGPCELLERPRFERAAESLDAVHERGVEGGF